MKMDYYIRRLLSETNRLTVPQLGTFSAHHITTQILKEQGVILPPRKQVTLDDTEQEDQANVFQNHIIKAEQIDYESFDAQLKAYINHVHEQINRYGFYEIFGVGSLKRDAAGKLFIENNTDHNLLNSSYGLPKLAAAPLQPQEPPKAKPVKDEPVPKATAKETSATSQTTSPKAAPVSEKPSYAAADKIWWLAMIPLVMLFVFLIYLMVDETAQLQFRDWISGNNQQEEPIITELPQQEGTAVTQPDEPTDNPENSPDITTAEPAAPALPQITQTNTAPSQEGYMVVLGSLAKKSAAEKMQKELAQKGIQTEVIYNSERNTYRIAISGLSESEAKSKREALLSIVPGAWIARPNQ
ncbi:MAG: SPOR domain-containing protein [Cytophagales bacterium]|nr:SPOR domain-containing protein [Bernardetiaceae bacterium]MDW8203543.1 SPOR domain-containing protein [Cytophagales bacterium]